MRMVTTAHISMLLNRKEFTNWARRMVATFHDSNAGSGDVSGESQLLMELVRAAGCGASNDSLERAAMMMTDEKAFISLIQLAVGDGRDDMVRILQQLGHYPSPTALTRVQHTFGETEVCRKDFKPGGRGEQRRCWIYSGVFSHPVQLELSFFSSDFEDADRQLRECTDALGWKVFHTVLRECYRQHGERAWCYWNPDTFCDLLGYKRRADQGCHRDGNKKQILKRLRHLARMRCRFEIVRQDEKMVFHGALLRIEQGDTATLYKGDHVIAKRSKLRVNDELYDDMIQRHMFAWNDERLLQINPKKHRKAIFLYSYYSAQLAMGLNQRRDERIITRGLDTILREAGIKLGKNGARDLEILKKEHDYLKREGLIEDWKVVKQSTLCEGELWQITFPGTHPAFARPQKKLLKVS